MATLTIRDLDDALKLKLRLRAASRNRSMEEEARQILRAALAEAPVVRVSFVERVKSRFEGLGDVVLPVEPREPIRQPLKIREPDAAYTTPRIPSRESQARSARPRHGLRASGQAVSILLDTDALSEILRSLPDPTVLRWFSSQPEDQLFVSAVARAEMVLGAGLLPQGRRQQKLRGALQELFKRISSIGYLRSTRAGSHAEIVVSRRRIGRPDLPVRRADRVDRPERR